MSDGPAQRSTAGAFAFGVRVGCSVPAAVLFATALGFGAMTRDGGFSMAQAAFISATMFAMPNQVMLVDQLVRNETLAAVALAVALTAMRLLPMTVTLVPLLARPKQRLITDLAASHFVAITTWLESNRHLPGLPAHLRMPFFLGLGCTIAGVMLLGTLLGHGLATGLPPLLTTALLFTTPIYFFLSLMATSRTRLDVLAVAAGAGLIPLAHFVVPGFDLLATGLIGGTLAFVLARRR